MRPTTIRGRCPLPGPGCKNPPKGKGGLVAGRQPGGGRGEHCERDTSLPCPPAGMNRTSGAGRFLICPETTCCFSELTTPRTVQNICGALLPGFLLSSPQPEALPHPLRPSNPPPSFLLESSGSVGALLWASPAPGLPPTTALPSAHREAWVPRAFLSTCYVPSDRILECQI